MDTKGLNFFGRYLIEKGIISQEYLDDAIKFQDESNRRIGELARERGYLKKEQTDAIFEEQKRVDQPFGVIALRRNYLTRGQLDDLLFAQTVFSTHLGEALLIKGYLTPEQFSEELEKFREEQVLREKKLYEVFQDLGDRDIYQAVVHSMNRAFLRFCGRELKIDSICQAPASGFDFSFILRVGTQERGEIACTVYLSEALGGQVSTGFINGKSVSCKRECVDRLFEFFAIVDRYLLVTLAENGLNVTGSSIEGGEIDNETKVDSSRKGLTVSMATPTLPLLLHTSIEKAQESAPCEEDA